VLLLVVSTGLSVVLAEVLLRAWGGALGFEFLLANTPSLYDTSIFQPDPEAVKALRPSARAQIQTAEYSQDIRIDAAGLRGPELPAKATDELRILAVGDSFTLGLQVQEDELFHARLARGLSQRLARPVTAWNAGVDGHGTPHAQAQMVRLAPVVDADVVLLTFFTGNDFDDNADYERSLGRRPRALERDEGPGRWLARRSVLAMNLWVLARALDIAGAGNGARHHRELSLFTSPDALAQQARHTRPALASFEERCRDLGVACFVAVGSPAFVVYPERRAASFWIFGLDADDVRPDAPAAAVLDALPATLPGLDLSDGLRAVSEEGGPPLYFTLDGHWTPGGHAAVAAQLEGWMGPALEALSVGDGP